jgi:hypothetical protein
MYDLADVPDAGFECAIAPGADELCRLAEWAGVEEVVRLAGQIAVRRLSRSRFIIETAFEAEIVQKSVITLEPVRSKIARDFSRTLQLSPEAFADRGGMVAPAAVGDDAPEEIESTRYDLALPLREELSLAIDPYPRAPGESFKAPREEDAPESPFAVLEKLKSAR